MDPQRQRTMVEIDFGSRVAVRRGAPGSWSGRAPAALNLGGFVTAALRQSLDGVLRVRRAAAATPLMVG